MYLSPPLASALHVDKVWWTAGLVIPVVLIVWLAARAVRRRLVRS